MPRTTSPTDEALVQAVHESYSSKAISGADESYSRNVARAFGYTPEQLQSIPADSNLGLSCGNPVAAANIKEGEKVLDLGSGGGIDILLAAPKVGTKGQAIGLDMSADMITLARSNAQKQNLKPPQVAFICATLTDPLPLNSNSIDCIISNCVINLLPLSGKGNLLEEAYRVLKPGGRIVLDDIIAKQALPDRIRNDLASYVGCISGAIEIDTYRQLLIKAGLTDVVFVDTLGDINVYNKSEEPSTTSNVPAQLSCCNSSSTSPDRPNPDFDANMWVASYQIYALKPQSPSKPVAEEFPEPLLRWWDAFPTVKSSPELMSGNELMTLMKNNAVSPNDFAVIDVRRNDHAGGHVRNSFQCPAQTFHNDLPNLFKRFERTAKVIFYCGRSKGRGPRCAGWYEDFVDENGGSSKAYVLEGGIHAWLEQFGNEPELVDAD